MAENLGHFFNTLSNELGPSAINLAVVIIAASIMNWILVLCLLVVLLRYDSSKKPRTNDSNHQNINNNVKMDVEIKGA